MGKNKQQSKQEKMKKVNDCLQLQKKLEEWTDIESVMTFSQVPLSTPTFKGLKSSGYFEPTKIQKMTLPHTLRGRDVLGEGKTGCGKTLAFVIPIMELLYKENWSARRGLAALIVTPTRELAQQIYDVILPLARNHKFTSAVVVGGENIARDWHYFGSMNIVVCTPGRLHHLITKCPNLHLDTLKIVVLDEADLCLSMGFSDVMNTILHTLPVPRQTLLFSATQTRDIKSLLKAGMNDNYVTCALHADSTVATPITLNECYTICEAHDKFNFLYSFLKSFSKQKILVFFSTSKQAKFYALAFTLLNLPMKIVYLHGGMKMDWFSHVFNTYKSEKKIVMMATDVASRGLDFVGVDWVVQLDCPEDVTTYVHRVGRTARYYRDGNAMLVLTKRESTGMLPQLADKVDLENLNVEPGQIVSLERRIEDVLVKEPAVKDAAERAFKAYVKNVLFMKDSSVFDVTSIDQEKLARSYGMLVPPRVQYVEEAPGSPDQVSSPEKKRKSGKGDSKVASAEADATAVTCQRPLVKNSSIKCIKVVDVAAKHNTDRFDYFFPSVESTIEVPKDLSKYLTKRDKVTASNAAMPVVCRPEKQKYFTLDEMRAFVNDNEYNKFIHREKIKKYKSELLTKRQERRRRRGQLRDDAADEKDEDDGNDELDPLTQQIIDELPDPDKIRSRGTDSESNDGDASDDHNVEPPSKRSKWSKSVDSDSSQDSDDLSSEEESDDFRNLALKQRELLALQLLSGK